MTGDDLLRSLAAMFDRSDPEFQAYARDPASRPEINRAPPQLLRQPLISTGPRPHVPRFMDLPPPIEAPAFPFALPPQRMRIERLEPADSPGLYDSAIDYAMAPRRLPRAAPQDPVGGPAWTQPVDTPQIGAVNTPLPAGSPGLTGVEPGTSGDVRDDPDETAWRAARLRVMARIEKGTPAQRTAALRDEVQRRRGIRN